MFYEEDNTIEIAVECFDNDLDAIQWEPEVIDDSDAEMAELLDYN